MSAHEAPTLIEFTGARGVGKSTFQERVMAALRERNIAPSAPRSVPRRARIVQRLSRLPRELRASYAFWRWKPRTLRDLHKFRARFLRHVARTQRADRGTDLTILDEGVFQLALTLHARTAFEDMDGIVSALARWMRLPDLVIFVQAPEEVILRRRRIRGNAGDLRASRMTDAGRRALVALERTLEATARKDSEIETVRVWIDDETDLDAAAACVAERIAARLNEAGRQTPPGRKILAAADAPRR